MKSSVANQGRQIIQPLDAVLEMPHQVLHIFSPSSPSEPISLPLSCLLLWWPPPHPKNFWRKARGLRCKGAEKEKKQGIFFKSSEPQSDTCCLILADTHSASCCGLASDIPFGLSQASLGRMARVLRPDFGTDRLSLALSERPSADIQREAGSKNEPKQRESSFGDCVCRM